MLKLKNKQKKRKTNHYKRKKTKKKNVLHCFNIGKGNVAPKYCLLEMEAWTYFLVPSERNLKQWKRLRAKKLQTRANSAYEIHSGQNRCRKSSLQLGQLSSCCMELESNVLVIHHLSPSRSNKGQH